MNYTDTTHYLFPVESKPGVVNVLPWLDEANTNSESNAENINQNNVQSNGDALVNLTEYLANPAAALKELQKNFNKYDTDNSQSLNIEELTAASTESAAAKWALSRYRPLSQVATENYSSDGIGQTEDFFARMQASRHVPIELSSQLFKDPIPSIQGISQQDLKTSLDFTDAKAVSSLLEGSATAEKKSAWGYLGATLISGGLAYPFYKICSRIHPVVGVVGGLLSALTSVVQLGHYSARRNTRDTALLEEQINKTRKMLGIDELAVLHPDKQKKNEDEKDVKNENLPKENKQAENVQNENSKEKGLQDQNLLNQCIQKETEKKDAEQQKLEQNNHASNTDEQTLMDQNLVQ